MAGAQRDREWCDELIRLGGSIHQDGAPPLSDEEDAVQQAGIERYLAMLDEFDFEELIEQEPIEAVLWSLHAIADYGIYETAYGALSQADEAALGRAFGRVLPEWLQKRGDHDSIAAAVWLLVDRDVAREEFAAAAAGWGSEERNLVLDALTRWDREVEGWTPVVLALGGVVRERATDSIPEEWPADWSAAALAFREEGRVDRAWLDEREISSNFPRVLALLEIGHGDRWREVPDLLNPLFVRRRDAIPAFIEALADLPSERRERILAAIGSARPETAEVLRTLLTTR